MSAERQNLVDALEKARAQGLQIAQADSQWALKDKQDGVAAMFEVADHLGWSRLGWKIAATNESLQRKLRTDEPVFGITYQKFLMSSPADIRRSVLLDPVIECEFAFRIGRDLEEKPSPYLFEEVADSIESVFLCMEVAECRFQRDSLPSPFLIMADGFASGWYVLGNEVPDWRHCLEKGVQVELYRNGEAHSSGSSHDVMGHPLKPVVWLANTLHKYGRKLQAGDLVSSGSCNILCRGSAETKYEAIYHGLGSIELTLE